MWPFQNPDAAAEERAWVRYRNRLADTLATQGYRGDPVSWAEARRWADTYVAEARQRCAAARQPVNEDSSDCRKIDVYSGTTIHYDSGYQQQPIPEQNKWPAAPNAILAAK